MHPKVFGKRTWNQIGQLNFWSIFFFDQILTVEIPSSKVIFTQNRQSHLASESNKNFQASDEQSKGRVLLPVMCRTY